MSLISQSRRLKSLGSLVTQKLFKVLPRGAFARAIAMMVGGTAIAQGLTLLAQPLLTRLYSPADFTLQGVYLAIQVILIAVASWRYELTIPLAERDDMAVDLLAFAFLLLTGMTILAAIVVGLAGDQITTWLRAPALKPYLWLVPFGLFGGGAYQILNYWAIRREAFSLVARTKLTQSLGLVITQVGLGLLRAGPIGLILGEVVGQSGGSGGLGSLVWKRDRAVLRGFTLKGTWRAAQRYFRFAVLTSASVLLARAANQMPVVVFAALYGPTAAGVFILARRILALPLNLVGLSTQQVYYGNASALARENPMAIRPLFYWMLRKLLVIGAVPIGLIALGGPDLFGFVFGAVWRESGVYVRLLALMLLLQLAVTPISQTLNILEWQTLQLAWDASRLVLAIGGFVVASRMGWNATMAVALFGGAMVVIHALYIVLCEYALRHTKPSKDQQATPPAQGIS